MVVLYPPLVVRWPQPTATVISTSRERSGAGEACSRIHHISYVLTLTLLSYTGTRETRPPTHAHNINTSVNYIPVPNLDFLDLVQVCVRVTLGSPHKPCWVTRRSGLRLIGDALHHMNKAGGLDEQHRILGETDSQDPLSPPFTCNTCNRNRSQASRGKRSVPGLRPYARA